MLVAYDASTHSPVGLLTLGGAEPGLNIGLLAVDWAARGRGVGRSLMQAAVSWATAQPRRPQPGIAALTGPLTLTLPPHPNPAPQWQRRLGLLGYGWHIQFYTMG